jgi:hypothetical protein
MLLDVTLHRSRHGWMQAMQELELVLVALCWLPAR